SYPMALVAPAREPYYAAILFEAARTLSRRLGAHSYPFGETPDGDEPVGTAAAPAPAQPAV
ncbi:MAG: hypothetical protein KIT16_15670, partial [Rhodospirillaceae bacterium]|nr:hypothetical protein [Rhodospirillaceae bacterium]